MFLFSLHNIYLFTKLHQKVNTVRNIQQNYREQTVTAFLSCLKKVLLIFRRLEMGLKPPCYIIGESKFAGSAS